MEGGLIGTVAMVMDATRAALCYMIDMFDGDISLPRLGAPHGPDEGYFSSSTGGLDANLKDQICVELGESVRERTAAGTDLISMDFSLDFSLQRANRARVCRRLRLEALRR
jgi:hypothetical protein